MTDELEHLESRQAELLLAIETLEGENRARRARVLGKWRPTGNLTVVIALLVAFAAGIPLAMLVLPEHRKGNSWAQQLHDAVCP